MVEAPLPPQAVEKSLAGEGLLAHVVVSKYVDHLPLYRLEQIFAEDPGAISIRRVQSAQASRVKALSQEQAARVDLIRAQEAGDMATRTRN